MAGASQRQTSKGTTAKTGQRKTAQKGTAKNSTAKRQTTQSNGTKSRTGSGSGSRSSNGCSRESEPFQLESFVGREILILAFFAVCLLLFLSNLGLCGAAGTFMRQVQCGIFGVLGYVFPLCLFVGVLFYVSNQYNGKAMAKLAAAAALFVVLCGLIGLMTTKEFDKAVTIGEYYKLSAEKPGGGIIGGIFQKILCPLIGKLGAYIVAILLMLMGAVFITERSVLQPISRGGKIMYDTAREDVRRRREIHEAKVEERRKYRLEQKVSGVALDTTVGENFPGQAEKDVEDVSWMEAEEKEESLPVRETPKPQGKSLGDTVKSLLSMSGSGREPAAKEERPVPRPAQEIPEKQPERPPIHITGIGFDRSEAVEEKPADPLFPSFSADVLIPRKDTRTLAELEALDSLHSDIFAGSRRHVIWDEPEENRLAEEPEPTGTAEYDGRPEGTKTAEYGERPEGTEATGYDEDFEQAGPAEYGKIAGQAGAEESAGDSERTGTVEYGETEEEPQTAESPVVVRQPETEADLLQSSGDRPEEDTPADVKRVVTATGKVVEVDIDPEDDPLTRKRIERRLAEREAAKSRLPEGSQAERPAEENLSPEKDWPDQEYAEGFHDRPARERIPDPMEEPLSFDRASGSGSLETMGQVFEDGTMNRMPGDSVSVEAASRKLSSAATGSASASLSAPPAAPPKRPPKPYVRPPYHLMKAGDNQQKNSDRELRETARKLEMTLQNFGVGVTVTNISCGPSVTRYELQPEQGVRVSKIVGLSDDIKLNLAAADIRIEAPIPGKASVGIEVPNKENSIVFLRDLLESKAFTEHPSKLAFAVGRDISGDVVVTDLAKMPHLLIAGATGSGKSVCINTLIMSVLYKATPEEVRLIMVDPKVVELSIYNGIPHLMIPVVTDPKKAAGALNWAVAEMTDRYKKFADWNVRDLKGYNQKLVAEAEKNGEKAQPLPQIVIIVDELADLMMVCPGDVEDAICRLAQMARAAGLHLVIATQRPSVNVITGLIKANVPSRIAFSVSSGVDSRTIIDMNGAEKLLGKGDMLFYPSGYQKPVRVQGAFVSDSEVSAVVDFLKENNESQTFDSAIEARLSVAGGPDSGAAGGGQTAAQDEYFAEAGRFIIEKQKASSRRPSGLRKTR